ncbi:hypothetical protein N7512_010593 [Penicillium capsulatum]|nr:hypothetical protein N7512_010593 [Penicillium capsulatum]
MQPACLAFHGSVAAVSPSGIVLAVAKILSVRGDWTIHVTGQSQARGAQVEAIQNITFHRADVGVYDELASVFQSVFRQTGRLDFIFANAGVFDSSPSLSKARGHLRSSSQARPVAVAPTSLQPDMYGLAVEVTNSGFYFWGPPSFSDDGMKEVMTFSLS